MICQQILFRTVDPPWRFTDLPDAETGKRKSTELKARIHEFGRPSLLTDQRPGLAEFRHRHSSNVFLRFRVFPTRALPGSGGVLSPNSTKSGLGKLAELAYRLPWWGGLLCALAAYALLHPIAMLQMPAPTGMVDTGATAVAQLFILLADIGQYLLPIAFLASAVISGFGRWKRGDLRNSVAQDTSGSILRGLPWPDFELFVCEALRNRGFEKSTVVRGSPGDTQGLALTRNDRLYLVDCTDWRSWRAGAAAVRMLRERVVMTGAHGGLAVTSGQFTAEAKHFAADKNIELVDGRHLKDLVSSQAPGTDDGGRSSPGAETQSAIARWRDRIFLHRRSTPPQAQATEARTRPDTGSPTGTSVHTIRSATASAPLLAGDSEEATGERLAALIREDDDVGATVTLAAPPIEMRNTPAPGRPRWRPRIRGRRVADILGMLLSAGVLWSTYEWFLLLPNAPADASWSLLGTGVDSDLLARRLGGVERSSFGGRMPDGERPLGQFRFGPPGRISDLPSRARGQGNYGSLGELEAAFDSMYVPPPECYAWESNEQMVKCGNHRIRTRKAFIASGGEETPMLLGAWEDPGENWRPYDQWAQHQGGERDQAWQPYAPEASGPSWRRGGEQDVSRVGDREHELEPYQDWRQELARGWGREMVEQPQPPQRQDWRQDWIRRPAQQPDGDWRGNWRQQPAQPPGLDPEPDWRRDWSQIPQGSAEDDWRRSWESAPEPPAGQHWVDDL